MVTKKITKTSSVKKLSTKSTKTISKAPKKAPAKKKIATNKAVKPAKKILPEVREKTSSKKSVVGGPVGVKPYQLKKEEEYMSDAQLKHFREILNHWKSQLLEEFDQTKQHMQTDTANRPDPVDRASQEIDFSLELRTRDRERKLLKKIDEALRRIEEHSYGYCDDCGSEIGVRRLEARPTATLCIDCKTIAELREKQVGEGEQE
jgi:DnaK suppressor protein